MKPAIVIAAYNRPEALDRLLSSVSKGIFPENVPLVISVDFGGARRQQVLNVAETFEWRRGEKLIIKHETHLGLKAHFFYTGALSNDFGSIIRLEDDYYVSPVLYEYASKALEFCKDDPRIAAISLYNVRFNGITKEPFIPYPDDGDNYFMQSPWSHGQAFLASQWEPYASWCHEHDRVVSTEDTLHDSWAALDGEEWFPSAAKYLVETNRFYVFPRESFCTNFGDIGEHFRKPSGFFQVPLQTRKRASRFQKLDDSIAVYDAFQEMMADRLARMTHDLDGYDFEIDLNGTKAQSKIRQPFVVTSQPCRSPIRTWGLSLYPHEANVVEGIPGSDLKLCRRENLRPGGYAGLLASFHQHRYTYAGLSIGLKRHILYWGIGQTEKFLSWYRRRKNSGTG